MRKKLTVEMVKNTVGAIKTLVAMNDYQHAQELEMELHQEVLKAIAGGR